MATRPKATTTVSATAGAKGAGVDLLCVMAPVPSNADHMPRLYGSSDAAFANHGFSEGVDLVSLYVSLTGQRVMFVPLPIVTPGTVGRVNTGGNTGTSVVSVAATGSGVLTEHDGAVRVVNGGTVGTDQIVFEYTLDPKADRRIWKRVRLGTANSYTVPYIGAALSFGAGTLVAGDTVIEWSGTAPRSDATAWDTARQKLAAQQKLFRKAILCGDLQNSTEANALVGEFNEYETVNERFTGVRASVLDRLPLAQLSKTQVRMTGNPSLTFAEVGATGDTITRSTGSWITDGFVAGDAISVSGSASNNFTNAKITGVTATVLTLDTQDLVVEGPVSNVTVTGTPGLTFAEVGASGDTITRSRGSWLDDGFRVGDKIVITGTASNNITAVQGLAAVTATVLTLGTDDLAAEFTGSYSVTLTAGETKAAWMARIDAAFAAVDDKPRIDLAAGRGAVLSPFLGFRMRRPPSWFAAVREMLHDLHIATWRKKDGAIGADLFDEEGNLIEWDERIDGGAGVAARFTTLTTYANDEGAFICQSLTRALDGSRLSQSHVQDVVNLACTVVHLNTETAAIGEDLVLNADGTAKSDSLNTIQTQVNRELDKNLLQNKRGEGQRASSAVWTPSADDLFNTPEPMLTGVLDLVINGTIHSVRTVVRVS